jgi:uncharacterized protein
METEFTPLASLAGGMLIGLAASLLLLLDGRVAGVSGIASRLVPPFDDAFARRLAFIAGLVLAPLLAVAAGYEMPFVLAAETPTLIVGGLLVGFGTVVGSGCTSGHGVCGIARLSVRSLAATATFVATAVATVFVIRHLL